MAHICTSKYCIFPKQNSPLMSQPEGCCNCGRVSKDGLYLIYQPQKLWQLAAHPSLRCGESMHVPVSPSIAVCCGFACVRSVRAVSWRRLCGGVADSSSCGERVTNLWDEIASGATKNHHVLWGLPDPDAGIRKRACVARDVAFVLFDYGVDRRPLTSEHQQLRYGSQK
jgi:hypothetical protein